MKKLILIAIACAALTLCSCAGSEETQNTLNTASPAAVITPGVTEIPTESDIPAPEIDPSELILADYSGDIFFDMTETQFGFPAAEVYTRDGAPGTMTVSLFDTVCTGEYRYTVRQSRYDSDYDFYWMERDSNGLRERWEINSGNGRIISMGREWGNYVSEGKNLSKEECAAIARDTMAELSGGLSYEIVPDTSEYPLDAPGTGVFYRFMFERKIGGIPTDEMVLVSVNTDGRVLDYKTQGMDAFAVLSAAEISELEWKTKNLNDENALCQRVKEICIYNGEMDITVSDRRLFRTAEGTCGILYSMTVKPGNGNDESALLRLFRPLD